jgi:hypothetical protein
MKQNKQGSAADTLHAETRKGFQNVSPPTYTLLLLTELAPATPPRPLVSSSLRSAPGAAGQSQFSKSPNLLRSPTRAAVAEHARHD